MKTKRRSFCAELARSLSGLGVALLMLMRNHDAHAQTLPSYNTLDSFSFGDTNTWSDDNGDFPIGFTNIVGLPGPEGNSMFLDTTNLVPAYLNYPVFLSGWTNLYVNQGTILFWFCPSNWSSAVGPGDWGRFIEAGSYTTNASYGWFSVYTDPGGQNIYFSGQTNNGGQATYLSYPMIWLTNAWHSIALAYSPTVSTLFIDGVTVTNGLGVAYYPGSNVLSNGFWIGSDGNGTNQARGLFSSIMTLDTLVDSNVVASLITMPSIAYDNGNAFNLISSAPSNPGYVPGFDAITGSGFLNPLSTNFSGCVNGTNNYNVWLTNIIATKVVSGTNLTMNVTFTIKGGFPWVPFDVFANSAMGSGTNIPPWAWMGQGYQCVTYELSITNQPNTACYLILGTPKDTSGYGLTDAYEYLVSQVDPHGSQTDGYGVPYAWYAENGLGSQSATQDPDLDGLLNYQEYLYGTHPTVSEGLAVWVGSPNGTTGIP
jgi:hypothetical protein